MSATTARPAISREVQERMAVLYRTGWSSAEIAREVGCHEKSVRRSLKRQGVEARRGKDAGASGRFSLIERILAGIEICGDCWHWTGYQSSTKYDTHGCIQHKGKTYTVHRVVWSHFNDELGDRKLRRQCDDALCCNPTHYEVAVPPPPKAPPPPKPVRVKSDPKPKPVYVNVEVKDDGSPPVAAVVPKAPKLTRSRPFDPEFDEPENPRERFLAMRAAQQ